MDEARGARKTDGCRLTHLRVGIRLRLVQQKCLSLSAATFSRLSRAELWAPLSGVLLLGMAIALLCGCETSSSLTFDTPEFELIEEEWKFRGRPGKILTTDHFEIYTTLTDEVLTNFVPGFLETTYLLYSSLAPAPDEPSEQVRMKTYIFDNRREWSAFTKQNFPSRWALYRKISAGGFAEGGSCVTYNIGRSPTLSVLAHEGWHQYIGSRFSQPIPAWVNEGLATYCEAVEFRRDTPYFTPQHNTFRINHLRSALGAGETLPLADLLSTDAGQVIDKNQVTSTNTYYAQSWALVVYLLHGADGQYADGFRRLLEGMRNGTIRIEAQAARVASGSPSETSYGTATFYAYITHDLESVEAGYMKFLEELCFPRTGDSWGRDLLRSFEELLGRK